MSESNSRDSAGQSADCNPHPDAPHGFDRTASHSEDRYVCDCEGWEPPGDLRTRIAAVVAAHRDQHPDCSCGWESWETSWDMHLADAVIRELEYRYVLVPKSQTLAARGEKALPGHKIVVTKTRSDEKQSLVCQCRWESNWGMENETRTEYSLHLIEVRKAFKYGENYGI